ncbi:hypothetical protein Caci_3498 [Catenulispora acidiphila DSM 44928]|uniref:Streptomyces killer toxin-like beta/gamma crystallin domain-containing protein n=1 Tax=Catenulispora acidiphila (strain DSM 44928 / JCM 14897 / NBRC 102108 / NRRL B-24433 / ID139908) TaxID=479433 RepID=C7Q984_CATAD|nr:hypothetical protein [Catenulispora acidiphila]ACU72404.1 hypothetical protein Caci_3498 [Catenulispora acidiphila DSM 44928]
MRVRQALISSAAAALLTVSAGAGAASAQTVTPNTGSTKCTPYTIHQYTKYHGTVCYTNPGDDNLYLSGYWTTAIYTGCNTGFINYFDANGNYYKLAYFDSDQYLDKRDWPTDVISLVYLHIDKVTC